jgi:hypothetical protein
VTSRQASYDANVTRPLLEACVAICKSCGDECERHARHHEHCRVCEQACRQLLDALQLGARPARPSLSLPQTTADTVRKRRHITIIRARLVCQPADETSSR